MTIVLKTIQTLITAILSYTTYTALQYQLIHDLVQDGRPAFPDLSSEDLGEPHSTTLLDLKNFTFIIEPKTDICYGKKVLFFIIVHSDPSNFLHRKTIRSTWGGLKEIIEPNLKWSIELIFLLGESRAESDLKQHIQTEAETHSDLLIGSFDDSYHNLTYKHLMGYKWSHAHCRKTQFILKADDDVFLNLPGLYLYLVRSLGDFREQHSTQYLAGNVFPDGTTPQRDGKWAVSVEEYPWDSYPTYLGGLAYLITPDVSQKLFRAAHHPAIQSLWIDDVFITGILAASIGVQPFLMNMKYVYEEREIKRWVEQKNAGVSLPYLFVHVNTSKYQWNKIPHNLWINTKRKYLIKRGKMMISNLS